MGISLTEGEHEIVWSYSPPGLNFGSNAFASFSYSTRFLVEKTKNRIADMLCGYDTRKDEVPKNFILFISENS